MIDLFTIKDGREHFYQWDIDRQLIVDDESINQVHFCNKTDDCSLICNVFDDNGLRVVNVPNILLTTDWQINVYAYDKNYTKYSQAFKVIKRTKPEDYVYTETEVLNYNTLLEMINDVDANIGEIVEDYLTKNPVNVDLSNYYTKPEVDALIPDVSGYATKDEVAQAVSDKVTMEDVNNATANFVTSEYVDNAVNSIPEPDLSNYALKSEIPDVSNFATVQYVNEQIAAIDIPEVDLSGYAKKTDLDDFITAVQVDEKIAAIPQPDLSEYAKMTDIPDVSGYQTEEQVNALINTALGVIENGTY